MFVIYPQVAPHKLSILTIDSIRQTRLIDLAWKISLTNKYTKTKYKNKVPYILGANCSIFDGFVVCGFTSFVQFVVVVVVLVFVPLLTDS